MAFWPEVTVGGPQVELFPPSEPTGLGVTKKRDSAPLTDFFDVYCIIGHVYRLRYAQLIMTRALQLGLGLLCGLSLLPLSWPIVRQHRLAFQPAHPFARRAVCVGHTGPPRVPTWAAQAAGSGGSLGEQDGDLKAASELLQLLRGQASKQAGLSAADKEALRKARGMIDEILAADAAASPTVGAGAGGVTTYAAAGVDVEKGDRLVDVVKELAGPTWRPGCVGGIGGFGALFNLTAAAAPPDALLVASTDGVGTKVLLAREAEDYECLGRDLVAMCVNDVLTMGAEPLFFLDYMGWPRLDLRDASSTLRGIASGCQESGCALIGGETAEMPGVYAAGGGRDLVGFVVAMVRPADLLPQPERMQPGDVVVGLPSSGVHANGLSLLRRLVRDAGLDLDGPTPFPDPTAASLRQAIMRPTRIYVRELLSVLRRRPGLVKGLAHITGGGLVANLRRVLPSDGSLDVQVDWQAWTLPPVFEWLRQRSGLDVEGGLSAVFNCGWGMCVVVDSQRAAELLQELEAQGMQGAAVIARLVRK